jgi:hypothetical protein
MVRACDEVAGISNCPFHEVAPIPTWVPSSSPRLRETSYLGETVRSGNHNPNRVVASSPELRGTSYSGENLGAKMTTQTGLRPSAKRTGTFYRGIRGISLHRSAMALSRPRLGFRVQPLGCLRPQRPITGHLVTRARTILPLECGDLSPLLAGDLSPSTLPVASIRAAKQMSKLQRPTRRASPTQVRQTDLGYLRCTVPLQPKHFPHFDSLSLV